ncbi:hypothetical protein QTP88_018166 [Uroleucon formosanum]
MKPLGQPSHSIKTKTKINKDKSSISNQNTSQSERIQSVSSDVFTSGVGIDENNFEFPNNKHKRLLSSPKSDTQEHKRNKPMFITANRYSPLSTEDNIIESSDTHTHDTANIEVDQPAKIKLPPPIFILQTTQPEFYRKTIHFLKEKQAQYHTYQPLEDKPFRVVIRNLHPSTPTVEIGTAIEDIGFSVRQVTNVIQKTTKNNRPMFFVDLEPAAINTDIFNVTSILHTKIKIEEPHKRRDILQCHNCQDYGHSKKYCSYSPRCVRCGDEHPSTHCTKTKNLPAKSQNSFPIPIHIRELIAKKRRARAIWQRTRLPSDKNIFNNLASSLKRILKQLRNDNFNSWVSSLTSKNGSLWKATRNCLKQKPINSSLKKENNTWCKTDKEKSELFRSHLTKVFQPHHDIVNNAFEEYIENSLISPLPLYLLPKPFTPGKLQYYIKLFPLKKSPGLDLITAKVARQLPKKAITHLTRDETWVYGFKAQSSRWKHSGSPRQKKSSTSMVEREGYAHCVL